MIGSFYISQSGQVSQSSQERARHHWLTHSSTHEWTSSPRPNADVKSPWFSGEEHYVFSVLYSTGPAQTGDIYLQLSILFATVLPLFNVTVVTPVTIITNESLKKIKIKAVFSSHIKWWLVGIKTTSLL